MLTLSMIVKNEEKHLRECLDSVKGIVDEIVLVDTGSTDKTLNIAQEYGAKIFHFNWINDFAAARNYSLVHSKGDWILYLDADERITKNSINELKKITFTKKKAAFFCLVSSIDEVNDRPSLMSYVRLFPNDKKISFEGAVHEQIEPSLRRNHFEIHNSGIEILHVGYNLDKERLNLKAKRNLEILLHEYKKHHTSYYAFQLGQTYGILNEKDIAINYFKIAILDNSLKREYKSTAYRYISVHFAEKLLWDNALENILLSIQNDAEQPLALLTAAKIYVKLQDFSNAEMLCRKAFDVNSSFIKKNKSSSQVIFLNEREFINHALGISIQIKNVQLFNYFYHILKSLSLKNIDNDFQIQLNLFDVLLNNKTMTQSLIDSFIRVISQSNLDLVLTLIDQYSIPESKIILLENINKKFSSNSSVLNKLGLSYTELKEYKKAELVFKESIDTNPNDPSTIFYLTSTYLQVNNLSQIKDLIEFAEKKFSHMKVVMDKLNLIKQKLSLVV